MLGNIWTVDLLELLPEDSFYVTVNGRIVDRTQLDGRTNFSVHFRLRGGKGGFGSLLRSFRIHRSTNQLMCRDLSGRRLADVKEEERLRKWIEEAGEREAEKARKRQEKYEKLKAGPPKHEFNDPEYIRTREKILDEADEAFEAGIAVLFSKKKEVGENTDKPADAVKGLDTEVDNGSDDDDGTSMLLPTCSRRAVKRKRQEDFDSVEQHKHEKRDSSDCVEGADGMAPRSRCLNEGERMQGYGMDQQGGSGSDQYATMEDRLKSDAVEISNCGNAMSTSSNTKDITSKEDPDALQPRQAAENREKFAGGVAAKNGEFIYPPVDLNLYCDVESLMKLGLEHLKSELEALGLKCGGSLEERAERLFAVKGLKPDEYPKTLKAAKQKKKKQGK